MKMEVSSYTNLYVLSRKYSVAPYQMLVFDKAKTKSCLFPVTWPILLFTHNSKVCIAFFKNIKPKNAEIVK